MAGAAYHVIHLRKDRMTNVNICASIDEKDGVLTVNIKRNYTGMLMDNVTKNSEAAATIIEAAIYNAIRHAHKNKVFTADGVNKVKALVIWDGTKIQLKQ